MLLAERLDGGLAGVEAFLAGVRADSAMLVMRRMLAAFVTAELARERANLELASEQPFIGSRAAAGHGSRGAADVGAIEVRTDALRELGDGWLAKARVGT